MRHQSVIGRFCALLTTWSFILTGVASAQLSSVNGTTPPGNAVGGSAGTYSLNDLENVNLYNGNLSFKLPLLALSGRGEADVNIALAINTKRWRIERERIGIRPEFGPPICLAQKITIYDSNYEIIGEGVVYIDCTVGESPGYFDILEYPVPESEDENLDISRLGLVRSITRSVYNPGIITAQGIGKDIRNTSFLTRLTFIASDGSSHELRDQLTSGRVQNGAGFNRGKVFVAADGSGLSFISDTDIIDKRWQDIVAPTGYLFTKSGTRYRVVNGFIIRIRDRNGNILNFGYDNFVLNGHSFRGVKSITDSLNRQVNINYADKTATIDYRGANGVSRTIIIRYAGLSEVLRQNSQYRISSLRELFPGLNYAAGGGEELYNPDTMISSVELPDGRRFRFYYNPYGQLARMETPAGGAAEYDYEFESNVGHRIKERRVLSDGTTLERKQSFNVESTGSLLDNPVTLITTARVETRDSSNSLLESSKHYFYGEPSESGWAAISAYAPWKEGREYKTEILDSNGNVIKRIEHLWRQRASVPWWNGTNNYFEPPNDPYVAETTTTLLDTNQVAKQTFSYDQFMNLTDVVDYNIGSGAPGALLRRIQTEYLTNNPYQSNVDYANDLNLHIRNLPKETSVFDGSGALISRTSFEYDRYDLDPLQDAPNMAQHDSSFHAGYGYRGNLVKTSYAVLENPGYYITTYNQYDIAGNVVKTIDGRGNATIFDYSDRFGSPDGDARSNTAPTELGGLFSYAFPTKIRNSLEHEAYTQYDYYLGRPVDVEDANGVVSSSYYNDPLDRPTQVVSAVNVSANKKQTTFAYDDVNRVVTTTSDFNTFNDNVLTGKSYYDSLGRTWRSAAREGATWTITDTRFDALGRVSQVSNPYRAADPDSASPPSGPWAEWTTTDYDALGRAIRVTAPDGAHVETAYSGNQVTITDQALKRRRSETDALGKLIRVTEDPGGLNYDTYYSYDALGNLRLVTQGAQTRTFVYDSLSRLTSATNPESGTMTYAYDPNGNLVEKTDARGVKTTMTYDVLNRVRSKVYSGLTSEGTAAANATPPVNYFYDDCSGLPSGAPCWPGTPSKGRLIGVTYGPGSEGTYYKYDAAGRIVTNHQRMGTSNYATAYFYNRAGAMTREERGIPARRRILMGYDAAGRLATMDTGSYPFLAYVPLVGNISYTPFGGLQSETYGNGLIHSMAYNNRLQPTEIRLGRPDDLESVFRLGYIYGTANNVNSQDAEITAAHNNGNVARIKYLISGTVQYTQTFQYDPLNRLSYAVEHNNGVRDDGARAWYQTFAYDRYGNRGINVTNTSDNVDAANSALKLAEFSGANNRITRAGFVYDAAGNLIEEPGKRYTYDAENRIVMATVEGGVTSQYVYDGNGRRVKKTVGGVATRFEYGAGGELIAEWNDADSPNKNVQKDYFYKGGELFATKAVGSSEYQFATSDHLGSPRAWTDGSGNLVAGGRHDYAPFGEELSVGVGIRSASLGYGDDSTRQKFTSKEHDSETGLDFFGARYFSSVQGRFTSPDEFAGGPTELFAEVAAHNPTFYADTFDPQTLNKYTYCLNNPLIFVDPDGHQAKVTDHLKFWTMVSMCQKCKEEIVKGGLKELGNIYIGIRNAQAPIFGDAPIAYYEPDNIFQEFGMTVTEHETVVGSFLGMGGPANVAMAEGKAAAVTTTIVNGVKVVDKFAGTLEGTVNLKPTLERIASGGKFPHVNDGGEFKNLEGRLPKQSAGYYKEYVVPTPGNNKAGVQRIVTGQNGEYYYTPDHYKTFIPLNK
jgi:RHS repeat-associated protein